MRLPFVSRYQAERLEERRKKLWDEFNAEMRVSGDLRRQVQSLKLENTEFRRQLVERDEVIAQFRRQLEEHDAWKQGWW